MCVYRVARSAVPAVRDWVKAEPDVAMPDG
jgi:hypothetical protein